MANSLFEAIYTFDPRKDDELAFKEGDVLYASAAVSGWFIGVCLPQNLYLLSPEELSYQALQAIMKDASTKVGIFPQKYVRPFVVSNAAS